MKHFFIVVLVVFSFMSCNDSDDNSPEPVSVYGLAVGNSWTYNYYERSSTGVDNFTNTGIVDLIEVIGTTEVENQTYFEVRTTTSGNSGSSSIFPENGSRTRLLREENGNLWDNNGTLVYTNNNYEERLLSTINGGSFYVKLIEGTSAISTNAGTFTCIDNQMYFVNSDGITAPGIGHNYYVTGIGKIKEEITFVASDEHIAELRLESYSVQ